MRSAGWCSSPARPAPASRRRWRDDQPPQQQPIRPHLTLEDPIEYLFQHRQSIVNQREIGIDTHSYQAALANALREAPDLIMIGEIRDRETMQQALLHTLTGHLCLSTIHANNSYHAMSRIINLFPTTRAPACCPTCRSACAPSSRSASSEQGRRAAARRRDPDEHVADRRADQERRDRADQGSDGAVALSRVADLRAGALRLHLDASSIRGGDAGVGTRRRTSPGSSTRTRHCPPRERAARRVDHASRRTGTDFASLQIDAGLLDRPH